MHARTRTVGRTRFQLLAAVVAAALIINGPLATGASAVDSAEPDPGASQPAVPTPEVTASEADSPEADAAGAAEDTDTEAPAATTDSPADAGEQPTATESSEAPAAEADQAPMVDPVEDTDESAPTDDQAPMVDPVGTTDESAPAPAEAATEESAPAAVEPSVPTDVTDGAPVEEFVPGIKVVPGDDSATIYWPDFGAEENYVVQFEQADGTWRTVEKDIVPADHSEIEGPIAPVDNQATVEGLKDGRDYTARIVSAATLAEASAATEPAVDLTPGGPRGMVARVSLPTPANGPAQPVASGTFRVAAAGETTLRISKVGDRTSGEGQSVAPLAGATFAAIPGTRGTPPASVDATSSYSCTTDATGKCDIVVPDRTGGSGTSTVGYWIVENSAPSGWDRIDSVGTGDYASAKTVTPYRFFTGPVSGTENVHQVTAQSLAYVPGTSTTVTHIGQVVNVRENPPFPQKCGLSIAMVFDTSTSVSQTEMNQMKTAAKGFIGADGVGLTPSTVSMYRFSDTASKMTPSPISIATGAGITQANGYINGLPNQGNGYTNWDDAFRAVAFRSLQERYDIVLVLTDGDPTTSGTSGNTDELTIGFRNVEQGALSANAVKALTGPGGGKTKIVAVGIGLSTNSYLNLKAISGPIPDEDYYASDFAGLQDKLAEIANEICGAVSIQKLIVDSTGAPIDNTPAGWQFTASTDGPHIEAPGGPVSTSSQTTPDSTGKVTFGLTLAGQPHDVTFTETPQSGFGLVQQGGYNATCTVPNASGTGSTPRAVTNTTVDGKPGFIVNDVRFDEKVNCVVKNQGAELQLVKKVDPAGSADVKQWKLSATTPPVNGETKNIVDAAGGTNGYRPIFAGVEYTLSETGTVEGFTNGTTWVCTGDGTMNGTNKVTVPVGKKASCEITNRENAAQLKLVKKVDPAGSADVALWKLSAKAAAPLDGKNIVDAPGGTGTFRSVYSATDYTLSESGSVANFTNGTIWTCVDAQDAPVAVTSNKVQVPAGGQVTCEITNTRNTAQLKLVKKVDPAGSADVALWKLSAKAAAPLDGKNIVDAPGGTGTFRSVYSATDYTLSESGSVANFTNGTIWTCVDAQDAPVAVTSNKVQVPAGGQVTCEITNTRNAAQLKLVKKVDPAGSADVALWKLSAKAAAPLDGKNIVDAPGGTGTFRSVYSATDYTLSESGSVANFTNGTIWTCVDAQDAPVAVTSNKVQVPAGGQVTCEITNTRNAAQLKLVKKVDPAGSADVALWKLSAKAAAPLDGKNIVDAPGGTGTFRSVYSATDYTLSESGSVANFTNGTIWTCVDAQDAPVAVTSNKVQVPAGGQVTCEITNTRNAAQLKLVKKVDPAGSADVALWKLSAKAAAPLDGKNIVDAPGGTGTFRSVYSATDYTLSESGSVANFTNGTIWTCVDAQDAPVAVTSNKVQVPAGGQVTCEITNTRNTAQLKLVKKVVGVDPADADEWDLSATGPQGAPIVQNEGGSGVLTEVWSGVDYQLAESDGPANYSPSAWVCEPAPVESVDEGVQALEAEVESGFVLEGNTITLDKGARVVCTITNTRDTASVKLQKAWVNARGGDTAALTIKGGLPESGAPNKTSTATGCHRHGAGHHERRQRERPGRRHGHGDRDPRCQQRRQVQLDAGLHRGRRQGQGR